MRAPSHLVLILFASAVPVAPAAAFDCAKAQSATEKAICGNIILKAEDDRMAAAYSALRAKLDDKAAADLLATQRGFIARREQCTESFEAPLGCILSRTGARADLLEGRIPASRLSGPQPLMSAMVLHQEGDETQSGVLYEALRFAEPKLAGERAFNRILDEAFAGANTGKLPEDERGFGVHADEYEVVITWLTPDVIAARESYYQYTGGAHGFGGVSGLLIDRKSGEVPTPESLFGKAGLDALAGLCREQIESEKRTRLDDYEFDLNDDPSYSDETMRAGLGDPSYWVFEPGEAEVHYNAYDLGAYAEGSFSCTFGGGIIARLSGGRLPLD